MKSVINLAAASTILFSLTCTLVSQLWAKPLVAFCLNEPNTAAIYSGTFVIIAAFQAVGRTRKPSASASSDVGRWMRSYSSPSAPWMVASKWSGRPLSRRASAWRWGWCCCAGSEGRGVMLGALG